MFVEALIDNSDSIFYENEDNAVESLELTSSTERALPALLELYVHSSADGPRVNSRELLLALTILTDVPINDKLDLIFDLVCTEGAATACGSDCVFVMQLILDLLSPSSKSRTTTADFKCV